MKDIYIKLLCILFSHDWRLAILVKADKNKLTRVCARCGEIE
jgi:hypothetical protein